jgi:antitoxin YefM
MGSIQRAQVGLEVLCQAFWSILVRSYRTTLGGVMDTVSVNQFRDNLKNLVEQAISKHEPLRVTRRSGDDFVVLSAEDWEREQATLYVLQNDELLRQIAVSLATHTKQQGYRPTQEQMDEISRI